MSLDSTTDEPENTLPKGALTLSRINLAGRKGGRKASFTEYNQFYQQGEITKYPVAFLSCQAGNESELRDELNSLGLELLIEQPISKFFGHDSLENAFCFPDSDIQKWAGFCSTHLGELLEQGWEINLDDSFYFRMITPDSWYGKFDEIDKAGVRWMTFDYGIEFDGHQINMIESLAASAPGFDPLKLVVDEPEKTVPVFVASANLIVQVQARHLGHIYHSLTELYEYKFGAIEIHPLRAAQLAEDFDLAGKRLPPFAGDTESSPPEGLNATLRPYQQQGLNWLQYLRENEINGILADDMGLGKTIQTLASIQIEKQSGRLQTPALIVAPTSVLSNWVAEARRFTPDLKVQLLHGPEREDRFSSIADFDLIITSYPLLHRDISVHRKIEYHYAILDEAQMIKNPKSQISEKACELKTKHRLCLTGTPMENHLGELWSLIHFLLPGFIGAHNDFRKYWQNPIEKKNDLFRRERLINMIQPIFLRRTKDDVLKDLPPRTDIVMDVTLEQGQITLYETARASMDKKIRQALAEKGLSRSHLVVLDALLKLRQICCDPRLLKTAAAKKIKSAKLEIFEDLIAKQVDAGRKILVFSQFTSMISLLEESLDKMKIDHVKLTGETTKREQVIDQFQEGDVPVFLISLKAGGFGLNLTAADCVIHYDPWWNPAVEEQATARAHRMGRKNPVFVYRLVTSGSIEERILKLQERKADLAEAVLSGAEGSSMKDLSEADVDMLLAPLDE